jgi:hypothetical protein
MEQIHTFGRVCNGCLTVSKAQAHRWLDNSPISTAPAVDPAIIDRNALGLSFFFSGDLACCAVAIVNTLLLSEEPG